MKITVEKCADCPFFGKTILSILGSRGSEHAGQCGAPAASHAAAVREVVDRTKFKPPVGDSREVPPPWCPLRLGDLVISIGNRGTA